MAAIGVETISKPVALIDARGIVLAVDHVGNFEWGEDGMNRLHDMARVDSTANAVLLLITHSMNAGLMRLMNIEGALPGQVEIFSFRDLEEGAPLVIAMRPDARARLERLLESDKIESGNPECSPEWAAAQRKRIQALVDYLKVCEEPIIEGRWTLDHQTTGSR